MTIKIKDDVHVMLSTILEGANPSPYRDAEVVLCGKDASESLSDGLFICFDQDPESAKKSVETAASNGAIRAIVAHSLQDSFQSFEGLELIFVDEPRAVYAVACQAFRGFPGRKLRLIGITGTAGKTSLSYVLGGVLAEAGMKCGLVGSLGVYDGQTLRSARQTTPEPDELAKLLEEMVAAGCVGAIIETSSVALAEKRLAGLELDAALLTNIRRDHLDYHGTVDAYRRTKMTIFDYLKPDGIAICNVDDRVTEAAMHLIDRPVLTVGIQPTACSVSGTPVERSKGEQTFYVSAGSDAVPFCTKVIGKSHVYNCLEASALALSWNIDLRTSARGVERVEYIPGRMERIDCGQAFGVFLDRSTTSHSLAEALETLRSVTTGIIYCVLCAPGDRDRTKRQLMAVAAESHADVCVVTSGNLPESQSEETLNDLRRGFSNKSVYHDIPDRRKAIAWALTQAGLEDSVLVVGQDVSTLEPINEYFVPDRQFIRDWLYENQPSAESYWYN
ncbi:MAG: Mur ligase family protein [Thermoguttaceae bacterium]|jgi:UDP-N-acetylmuramoyl-L-alanyl-D-glutamate--2,6-diaminopimelate ligase